MDRKASVLLLYIAGFYWLVDLLRTSKLLIIRPFNHIMPYLMKYVLMESHLKNMRCM